MPRIRRDVVRLLNRRRLRRQGVTAGPGSTVARGRFATGTIIGHHTAINGPAVVKGPGRTSIGARCAIGDELRVITDIHRTSHPNVQKSLHWELDIVDLEDSADVSIGNACWIGDRVTILPGAVVGDGAVIAAGAVVRGTIAPYTIVGGVPARELRRRCPTPVANALISSAWWDWSPERCAERRAFFELDIGVASAEDVLRAATPHA